MPEPGSARLHPLHRLWRALPQDARRAVLRRGASLLAPRPDQPPPPALTGIAVAGELDLPSGIGEGARLMLQGLRALGVPCWPVQHGAPPPPPGVPLVLHGTSPAMPVMLLRLGRAMLRGRRVVGFWNWELPVAPPAWRTGLPFVHEVWTSSRFSAAALEALAPGRVRVVHFPVALQPPAPAALGRAAFGLPEGCVVTLVAFNLASSFERKNPLGAIAAFRAAFGDRADRLLLLRIGNPHHFPADFARLQQAVAGSANIRIDTETRPRHEAAAMMAASDIVLSLHRSEGFGLVPAEAMLIGKPVVATDWSGTQDFMVPGSAALIPARLVPARDPRGVFVAPGAVWAEPDGAAAAAWLVRLADDPALRARIGAAGQAAAQSILGTQSLAEAVRGLGLTLGGP